MSDSTSVMSSHVLHSTNVFFSKNLLRCKNMIFCTGYDLTHPLTDKKNLIFNREVSATRMLAAVRLIKYFVESNNTNLPASADIWDGNDPVVYNALQQICKELSHMPEFDPGAILATVKVEPSRFSPNQKFYGSNGTKLMVSEGFDSLLHHRSILARARYVFLEDLPSEYFGREKKYLEERFPCYDMPLENVFLINSAGLDKGAILNNLENGFLDSLDLEKLELIFRGN